MQTSQEGGESSPREQRRILVVEDNDDTAETLALILRMDGHEVRIVHDAASALAEASEWRPWGVFLDINLLGEMDGFEAARRLRSQNGASLRLVALTGCGEETDRQRAEEVGFDCYLVKPADREDLVRALS